MDKIFVTSDIWFNRPLGKMSETTTNEYNDLIISNWNKTVGKKDTVFILGGLGIGDIYHLMVKLNGEIYILNNFFTQDEIYFAENLRKSVSLSIDKNLKNKILFSSSQIIPLVEYDAILSYLPLSVWSGCDTGTFCFHGMTDESNLMEHNISCKAENWNYKPILITDVQENLKKFSKNI